MKIKNSTISGMNIHYKFFPLDYFLDKMVENGYETIELWGAYPHHLHHLFDDISFPSVQEVKSKIRSRGLNISCYTPEQVIYPINIAAKEDYIRQKSIEYFKRCLEAASELETDKMLVTPGWGYFNEDVSEAWARTRESLQVLGGYAQKCGIKIALENLRQDESNIIYNLPTLKKMLDEVAHPYIKGMVDTIPMAIAGETLADYFETIGGDLIHIHFLDGMPRGHLAWGDGILPLEEYLRTVEKYGYQGYLSLEITDARYYFHPEEACKKSIEAIRKYI